MPWITFHNSPGVAKGSELFHKALSPVPILVDQLYCSSLRIIGPTSSFPNPAEGLWVQSIPVFYRSCHSVDVLFNASSIWSLILRAGLQELRFIRVVWGELQCQTHYYEEFESFFYSCHGGYISPGIYLGHRTILSQNKNKKWGKVKKERDWKK